MTQDPLGHTCVHTDTLSSRLWNVLSRRSTTSVPGGADSQPGPGPSEGASPAPSCPSGRRLSGGSRGRALSAADRCPCRSHGDGPSSGVGVRDHPAGAHRGRPSWVCPTQTLESPPVPPAAVQNQQDGGGGWCRDPGSSGPHRPSRPGVVRGPRGAGQEHGGRSAAARRAPPQAPLSTAATPCGEGQAHRDTAARLPGASSRPASAPAGSGRLRAAGPCLRGRAGQGGLGREPHPRVPRTHPPPPQHSPGAGGRGPTLTLSLDSRTVDGHVGVAGGVPRAQDLSAQAPGDARELGGVQVEGLSGLHGKLGAPAAPGWDAVGALRKGARRPDTAP